MERKELIRRLEEMDAGARQEAIEIISLRGKYMTTGNPYYLKLLNQITGQVDNVPGLDTE